MMIYRIHEDNLNYQNFFLDLEEVLDVMDESIGEREFLTFSVDNLSLKAYWPGFEVRFNRKSRRGVELVRPDLAAWRGANLVMSERSVDVLGAELANYGEFLPLSCEGANYYIFNCQTLGEIDELRSSQSKLDGYVVGVEKLVFDGERVADKLVFKTPYERCISLFCQDEFKFLVEEANLTGLIFNATLDELI